MKFAVEFLTILALGWVNAQFRIIGGNKARIEEFPFTAFIAGESPFRKNHLNPIAGGVIVGPKNILTAAHVCKNGETQSLFVRVGSTEFNTGGEVIPVQNYTIHPKYDDIQIIYDYCMMQLKKKIKYSSKKKPAVLPGPHDKLKDGDMVQAAGWGQTMDNFSSIHLQKVSLLKISNEKCQEHYPDDKITEHSWCAIMPGSYKKTFHGDSGGPIIAMKDKKLYGIVSWGTNNKTEQAADVYADVPKALKWIKSFIHK